MPSFSSSSRARLDTCDARIQRLFNAVIIGYDCTVIEGHRPKHKQDQYYADGKSKLEWPNSKHNSSPSKAVDVAPYLSGRGIPWPGTQKDYWQFVHFAGYVLGIANELDISIRWGGDWDRDFDMSDQRFDDLVHFELY